MADEQRLLRIERDIAKLERRVRDIERPAASYSITNAPANTRSYDADAATLATIRDVLATLLADLRLTGQ